MITIYAEKPDMGTKIAAALDGITLDSGTKIPFSEIQTFERNIKAQRTRDGYFKIHYLGQPAYVTWGYGHMCGLKQAKDYNPEYQNWKKLPLPFIPSQYELKLSEGAKKQYRVIQNCFKKSNLLICATDDDREGDLIFDYLYRFMKCTVPFKRAVFNKQSEEEYQKAFSAEHLIDSGDRMPIIDAGRARSAGDFITGAGPTVALSLKYPGNSILSVGRVQTATLNMIVKRELEIQNFQPKDYSVVKGLFTTESGESYIGIHSSKKVDTKKEAEEILNRLKTTDRISVLSEVKTKQFQKVRPYLYSLDSLQIDANKTYGFSLEETLNLAQSLYEKGLTTYPRTDCIHLPNDMVAEVQGVMENLFSNPAYAKFRNDNSVDGTDKHYFDSSKVESHYAIVPTTKPASHLTDAEQKLYHLIAKATICMVYPDATLSRTELVTDVHGDLFHTSGTSVIEPGFLTVLGMPKEKILPSLKQGDMVTGRFAVETKQTEPPKRYTAATLVNAMLNCGKTIEDEELRKLMADGPGGKPRGLGRPSSRASIVSTLEKRGYTTLKGKSISPTPKGMQMIACFPVADLKSAVMTASWEKRLDDIEKGTDTYESFMHDLEDSVRKWTKEIIESTPPDSMMNSSSGETALACPLCGLPLIQYPWGYGCSGRNAGCEFSIGSIAKKKLTAKQIQKLLEGQKVHIKGMKSKKGTKFEADVRLCLTGEKKGNLEFV